MVNKESWWWVEDEAVKPNGFLVPAFGGQRIALLDAVFCAWLVDHPQTLTDELGVTEYLADRFALVGTPEQCVERVAALRDAGLRQLLVPALGRDPMTVLRRFGEEVFSRFRAPAEVGR